MTNAVTTAWYRGLADLSDRGVELLEPGHEVMIAAWQEYAALASQAESVDLFAFEAPKLAAYLLTEALERHKRGLPVFDSDF